MGYCNNNYNFGNARAGGNARSSFNFPLFWAKYGGNILATIGVIVMMALVALALYMAFGFKTTGKYLVEDRKK